jgi:hypothetical protein
MGLFSSKSSSKTYNTTNTENFNFNNVDYRKSGSGNLNFNVAKSNGNTFNVQQTDLGAINKAFEFADDTLQIAREAAQPDTNLINTLGKNITLLAVVVGVSIVASSALRGRK